MFYFNSRRQFLRNLGNLALVSGLRSFLLPADVSAQSLGLDKAQSLMILHTNDQHSRIEPFPMDGSSLQGRGGFARRHQLIQELRAKNPHVLLLDAGDVFQGTPYFNYFQGELEYKLMSKMAYDASTIGNHEFDAGLDNLAKQIRHHAKFSMICSNYQVEDTPLEGLIKPYQIFKRGGLRIGVFGLGIALAGLVPDALCLGVRYQEPLPLAQKMAEELRCVHGCDYVICLSHLGYRYETAKVSDWVLAQQTQGIDLIIGGHTHTFLEQPLALKNAAGQEVWISQAGWAGVLLGCLEIHFTRQKMILQCKNQKL